MEIVQSVEAAAHAIRAVLQDARSGAYRAVNSAIVQAYWQIGRILVEHIQRGEERAEFGARLLEDLASRLTVEFGPGFDARNLLSMRRFYPAYPIPNALRSELSWAHYRLLLGPSQILITLRSESSLSLRKVNAVPSLLRWAQEATP